METKEREMINTNHIRIGQNTFVKRENWKRLFDIAKHWNYGTEHCHDEISEIIGLVYDKSNFQNTASYYNEVKKANRELQKIGKLLQVVHGVGYRVVNPNEYVDRADWKEKQGVKRIKQALEILIDTPVELLDDAEKGIHRIKYDAKRSLLVLCKQNRKDVNKMLREETRIQIRTGRN